MFELTPNGSGGWTEKKLHNFGNPATTGIVRLAGLIFDAAGNLYGTTRGRHLRRRDGVRVDAQRERWLDGEGAA